MQDAFIFKNIEVTDVKQRRKRQRQADKGSKNHDLQAPNDKAGPVCQKAFMSILHITRGRIRANIKNYKIDGKRFSECAEREEGRRRKNYKIFDEKRKCYCLYQGVKMH